MALTKEQLFARDGKITASFMPYLMRGDQERILNEWRMLVGDPEWKPYEEDADSWLKAYGSHVEPFIIDWHQRRGGHRLTRRGEFIIHPTKDYIGCTLDCFREHDRWVIDVKNFHSFRKLDDALPFYIPQLIVQKACTQAVGASLLYSHGGLEPKEQVMEWSPDYEKKVWDRIDQFWHCVTNLIPPYELPDESAPPPPNKRKSYNFEGNNKWADLAATWLETHEAADRSEKAKKEMKTMVPKDASDVVGHGVIISRDAANKLHVKKVKTDGKK